MIGTTRSAGNPERSGALGAEAVELGLLDARAVRSAVLETRPDAIVHHATALANAGFSRKLDRPFAQANRLRTEGTDALLAAAPEAGVRRFVAQSFAPDRHAREGGPVKAEDDRLDPVPPSMMRETSAAIRYLDQAVTEAGDHGRRGLAVAPPEPGIRTIKGEAQALSAGFAPTWHDRCRQRDSQRDR